jgi:hypothetical protein
MATSTDPVDQEPRFSDNFLQDRNIKWILGIGTAILLGSSLMLVSSQWGGYSAALKQGIILAYTAMIYAAGRYSFEQLALRRTGTMLLTLAVLLVPVTCAALPWLWESETWNLLYLALLAANGALAIVVGRRAFQHLFHGPNPTLTASFVALSLAGAVVPVSPVLRSPWMAVLLWLVFAVGTIKANRRIFWLIEEHRQPRGIGFLPMMLLAAQFLTLFSVYFAGQFTLGWIGLGCVLSAIPVLLSADTVAHVFQQRTGDLIRPLPWSILAPLGLGLLLCAVGVCLSGTELLDGYAPYSLVPTATLAAGLMAVVARRTRQSAFVWVMLFLATIVYRFLPVFFADTVRMAIETTAAAIHESRLPWAFYGFTFVPLLGALIALSRAAERRGSELFAMPARRFSVGLALLFLCMAPTHAKAIFPAGLTLAAVFAMQTVLFRNRAIALPAVLAWLLAAIGLPVFFAGVVSSTLTGDGLPATDWLMCEVFAAAALLVVSTKVDPFLNRLPLRLVPSDLSPNEAGALRDICRRASLAATGLLMICWLGLFGSSEMASMRLNSVGLAEGLAVAALGFAHALLGLKRTVSVIAWTFANLLFGWYVIEIHQAPVHRFVSPAHLIPLALLAQWLLSYWLAARPTHRVSQAFAFASRVVPMVGLVASLVLFLLGHAFAMPHGGYGSGGHENLGWFVTAMLLAWVFDAARRERQRSLGTLAVTSTFVFAASAVIATVGLPAMSWLPTVIVLIAALYVPFLILLRRRGESWSAILGPADTIIPGVLAIVTALALFRFTLPMFVAGGLAPLALLAFLYQRKSPWAVQGPMVALNWRALGMIVPLVTPEVHHLSELIELAPLALCLPVALAAAASVLLWNMLVPNYANIRRDFEGNLAAAHCLALRMLSAGLLIARLGLPTLSALEAALVIATLGILAAIELLNSCRQSDEGRVWFAEGLVAVAVGYLAWFRVLTFGHGIAMFLVLALGLSLWLLGRLTARYSNLAVMSRPFRLTGRWLPLVTVGMAVARHIWHLEVLGVEPRWLGHNSLAILLAAAFYFWQGLETRGKPYIVLAAAILNVAIVLLWRELHLTDPQFYMIPIGLSILWLVELLQKEIPVEHHTPLRYLGALVILVSPTFHIVHGSWIHLFALMLASVVVILMAMGLRVRALIYTGTAFLAADLVAMVIRGSVDRPQLLWVAGLALGASVLGLGAVCELRREQVLQRVRAVTTMLSSWH